MLAVCLAYPLALLMGADAPSQLWELLPDSMTLISWKTASLLKFEPFNSELQAALIGLSLSGLMQ
jgi:hypothetical protein